MKTPTEETTACAPSPARGNATFHAVMAECQAIIKRLEHDGLTSTADLFMWQMCTRPWAALTNAQLEKERYHWRSKLTEASSKTEADIYTENLTLVILEASIRKTT